MLPNEEKRSAEIRVWWGRYLDLLADAIAIGCGAHRDLHGLEKTEPAVVSMAGGILAKQIKHGRSLHALATLGLHQECQIILRAMLEGTIATTFLCRETVELGVRVKAGDRKRHRVQTDRLLRAMLYAAHLAFDHLRLIELVQSEGPPQIQPSADHVQGIKATALDAESAIGPEWADTLRSSSATYAGLDLKSLAKELGMFDYYLGIYKQLSWPAHGMDGFSNAAMIGENAAIGVMGSVNEIGIDLELGTGLLFCSIETVDDAFALGFKKVLAAHCRLFETTRSKAPTTMPG